ncbi:hypothetical protein MOUN0_N04984 [Monosporozyma unispora]|nr:hypothetical protein C6P44_005081 [Kazachstania unispora]
MSTATTPIIKKSQTSPDSPLFRIKKENEESEHFLASFEPDFSLLSNGDDKNVISPKMNKSKSLDPVAFSSNSKTSNNNNFVLFGSELKRDNSQRSFSLDLTNKSALTNHNTSDPLELGVFHQSLVHDNILNPTFTTGNNDEEDDDNTVSAKALLMEFADSTGDDDENNSPVFSPRSFISRPSSISSSSINEIVSAVVASRDGKRERTRRVRKVKASHNDIEKKYRLSINDKIVQLRNLVPTIRYGYKEISNIPLEQNDIETLDGLEPTRKMNKGTILNKTIEYIKHLEAKCEQYKSLNDDLLNKMSNDNSLNLTTTVSSASSTTSSTVVTPMVKLEKQIPLIPSQQEFNLNILQNSAMDDQTIIGNKDDEPFSPLAKVFIDNNDSEVVNNNLFKFDNFS